MGKTCTKCKKEYPATVDFFPRDKNKKDGLFSWCKTCKNYVGRGNREAIKYQQPKSVKGGHKICSKCRETIPASTEYFAISKRGKYGLSSTCKKCMAIYRDGVKEHIKEMRIADYEKNSDRYKQRREIWYRENKEYAKEYGKQYHSVYRKTPYGKYMLRKNRNNYFAQKSNLLSTLTFEEWELCLCFFEYKDAYTGKEIKVLSQDHIIPVSKGGHYVAQNIVPCEKTVNSSKCNRDMLKWYKKQPFFSEERLDKIYQWQLLITNTH